MKSLWICTIILAAATAAYSAQNTYSDTGGTVKLNSTGTTLTISGATLASPAGTVSMSCSLSPAWSSTTTSSQCKGGSLSLKSSDGSTTLSGSFTSGVFTQKSVTGGYLYALNANFAGSLTTGGAPSMAVFGSVVQDLAEVSSSLFGGTVSGTIHTGAIYASQRYEPLYIADTANNRIVSLWDIEGDTWTSFGTAGSGTNHFSHPWGIFVTPTGVTSTGVTGTIYVSDSGNCRIVSFTSMSGANWTPFGSCGSGTGQFSNPEGIFVDATGHIYVADTGNNRVVRMDDMKGTNFTRLGTVGTGIKQFSSPGGIALDSLGMNCSGVKAVTPAIYVADGGNSRVVCVNDMTGSGWTTMNDPNDPVGIWLDSSDRIYTANTANGGYVVRVDNMAYANPAYLGATTPGYLLGGPRGVFVDPDGAVYVADTGNSRVVRTFDMNSTLSLGQEIPDEWTTYGVLGTGTGKFSSPSGVFAVPVTSQVPVALYSTTAISFPTKLVGTASPAASPTLTNIGTGPFTVNSVTVTTIDYAADVDFTETKNTCVTSTGGPLAVTGGHACYASVVFQPSAGGLHRGNMTFSLTGAPSKSVSLSGWGALVTVSCTNTGAYAGFACPPLITNENNSGTVAVTNPFAAATTVFVSISPNFIFYNIQPGQPYCSTTVPQTLAPGATCYATVLLNLGYTPPQFGTLTVTDGSGAKQSIKLQGE